jgi:GABA(A) receptor-associated protein
MSTKYFKDRHSFDKRFEESSRIVNKYKTKKPVIVEKKKYQKNVPDIDRSKFLVPDDLSMAEFMYVIRKRIKITPDKSIFLFVGDGTLVPSSLTIGQVYSESKDMDGFLYIKYCGESTFG